MNRRQEGFHEIGWRIVRDAAAVHFRTESPAQGLALVAAIGRLAEASREPDVDLRPGGVTVRINASREGELTEDDVTLAAGISAAAREVGAVVDRSGLQAVQIAIDALSIPDLLPFWRAVLGYEQVGDEDIVDPRNESPPVWFQQMDAARPQRNRIHVDLYVPEDEAEARVAAALAAGGRVVADHSPDWWTLADPEGNEVDVAPWPDRT